MNRIWRCEDFYSSHDSHEQLKEIEAVTSQSLTSYPRPLYQMLLHCFSCSYNSDVENFCYGENHYQCWCSRFLVPSYLKKSWEIPLIFRSRRYLERYPLFSVFLPSLPCFHHLTYFPPLCFDLKILLRLYAHCSKNCNEWNSRTQNCNSNY